MGTVLVAAFDLGESQNSDFGYHFCTLFWVVKF